MLHTKLAGIMCTGRVDLAYVLRAFSKGINGVFTGVRYLNEYHHITVVTSYSVCKVYERKVYGVEHVSRLVGMVP